MYLMFTTLCSTQAEEMILRIKRAFIGNLPNLKWMDDDTRTAAISKVAFFFKLATLYSFVKLILE